MQEDPRLAELLMQWEESRAQGQTAVAEELCSDSPELLDELQWRIRALEALDPILTLTPPALNSGTIPRSHLSCRTSSGVSKRQTRRKAWSWRPC